MNNMKKNLSESEKNIAAFCLLLSDSAFQAWMGEAAITPEIYKEICQVSEKFYSPELTIKICEKFPGMVEGSHL